MKNKFIGFILLVGLYFQINAEPLQSSSTIKAKEPGKSLKQAPFVKVPDSLNILFIGNSFTFRHNLPLLVKRMAEDGNPNLKLTFGTVAYGGHILKDHWRLRSQNFIKQSTLTVDEEQEAIRYLEETHAKNPKDGFAVKALVKHKELLDAISKGQRDKWDVVVLQSWTDDYDGEKSAYMEYAPKYAEIIKSQGGLVFLYETAPFTQNATPLLSAPEMDSVLIKEKHIAELAKRLDAKVVPMSMVALRCQTLHPEITLRYVQDEHPNQTMAYLAACTFYSALFGRSPEGLPLDRVKDTKPLKENPDLDQDGKPIEKVFSEKERTELQRIAWAGWNEFYKINK
jgi:hypothetical protein